MNLSFYCTGLSNINNMKKNKKSDSKIRYSIIIVYYWFLVLKLLLKGWVIIVFNFNIHNDTNSLEFYFIPYFFVFYSLIFYGYLGLNL